MRNKRLALLTLALSLNALPALAADKVTFKDRTGDDNGPGTYKYPTDVVYKAGSFDMTEFTFEKKGTRADLTIGFNSMLEDPWKMGSGFSVQMVFVFIDTDGKAGSGYTGTLPGLNVEFAPSDAWEKVVIISPQSPSRVTSEVSQKAGAVKDAVLIPTRVKGSGKKVVATVDPTGLEGDPSQWGYQVLVQSNEPFPSGNDLLTRRVNEFEGQHRFGGGHDGMCDPHVLDLLAGSASGDSAEMKAQHEMLAYECTESGEVRKKVMLKMVRKSAPAAQ